MDETKFRIGEPDEVFVLLWARGDPVEDIARKYDVPLHRLEAAIEKHGHRYRDRPAE